MIIREASATDALGGCAKGPRTKATKAAQEAVEAFIGSGYDACEVDWRKIDGDFDKAKSTLSARISWTKFHKDVYGKEADGVHLASNRKNGKVYLLRGKAAREHGLERKGSEE